MGTLGTQSQRAKSRLVTFPFYELQKSIGTGFNDCVQASLTVRYLHSLGNAPVGVQTGIPHPSMSIARQKSMKPSSRSMNSHMKSVVPPKPQARQNGYMCEDRTTERTWNPNAKAGNTGSQPAGGSPTRTEIAACRHKALLVCSLKSVA